MCESLLLKLRQWQRPVEMFELVRENRPIGGKFLSNEWKECREAYVMGVFSIGYELLLGYPVEVRTTDQEPADAQLRAPHAEALDFQISERLEEGRERHKDYKDIEAGNQPPWKSIRSSPSEVTLRMIRERIWEKENKRYGPPPCLLVYVNFDHEGLNIREVAQKVVSLGIRHLKEVWLVGFCDTGFFVGQVFPKANGFRKFDALSGAVISEEEVAEQAGKWV